MSNPVSRKFGAKCVGNDWDAGHIALCFAHRLNGFTFRVPDWQEEVVSNQHSLLAWLVEGTHYGYQLRVECEKLTGGPWPLISDRSI